MSTVPPRVSAPLDEFVRDLLQFTHACGSPHYRELAKLAPAVRTRHKKRIPVLRSLSLTAISNVMSRQRQGPQPWGWVATYVLTCLHYAEKTGVTPEFPGPSDLQGWHARYQVMRDQLDRLPAPAAASVYTEAPQLDSAVTRPEAVPAAAGEVVLPSPAARTVVPAAASTAALAASPVSGGQEQLGREARGMDGQWACPAGGRPQPEATPAGPESWRWAHTRGEAVGRDELGYWLPDPPSQTHRRYFELFGQHGVNLLIAAEGGVGDAAGRLGILLLCHDRPAEGLAWLASAAGSGDEAAKVLVNAAPSQRKQMAAELAYELTLPGYRQDHARGSLETPTGAESYYRAATSAGHLGAAVRMGLIYEARGETTSALFTFAQAANRHHPDAHHHFARLNRQFAQHQLQGE